MHSMRFADVAIFVGGCHSDMVNPDGIMANMPNLKIGGYSPSELTLDHVHFRLPNALPPGN